MRLFFGLEADRQTSQMIADWRNAHLPCDGRAVPPANFHITLAFMGELSHQQLDKLVQLTDERLGQAVPGAGVLNLDTVGYWAKPGIYWLGPRTWPDALSRLRKKLAQAGTTLGAKRDRNPFQPHVTLYRRCEQPPPAPTREPDLQFEYRHFGLFESVQGKNSVHYQALETWEMA